MSVATRHSVAYFSVLLSSLLLGRAACIYFADMDIPTTSDSEDEYDGGTMSEFEGSDDSEGDGDTFYDPDEESEAGSECASSGVSGSPPPSHPAASGRHSDFTLLSYTFIFA